MQISVETTRTCILRRHYGHQPFQRDFGLAAVQQILKQS
jgi:hypothetical protein